MAKKPPSLRHHKASGRAFVELTRGQRTYLGKWGTPEATQAYSRLLAESHVHGGRAPVPVEQVTVVELCDAYLAYAEGYYVGPDGKPTSTMHEVRSVIDCMLGLYGDRPVASFGPLALQACRGRWIDAGLTVGVINKYCGRVRAMFKWAVACEMASEDVYRALCCVPGLRRGRGVGKDTADRQAVDTKTVEATLKHMPPTLQAVIRLLLLTGARPSEVLRLRKQDIDCTGPVWTATIREHKLAYRGVKRVLYFGPRAQAVLRPFLLRPDEAYLFSPREAEAQRHADCDHHRRPGTPQNPKLTGRVVGDCYEHTGLAKAIRRVCDDNDIPRWTPYQLRHAACTTIEASSDPDTARAILGHASLDTTAIYMHRDATAALNWAQNNG